MSILTDSGGNAKIIRPGKFGDYNYKARQYVRLNNSYIQLGYTSNNNTYWQYKYDASGCDDVIIRCEIPQNASGYIMGFRGSSTSNEFSISISGGTITYKIGSTTRTHAWAAGVHNIGFTHDLYAYFDGKTGTQMTQSSGSNSPRGNMVVGGWYKNGTYEAISSIDIYEVLINGFWVASQRNEARFYAASGNSNDTPYLFQTRIDSRAAGATALTSGTSSCGSAVTYGVQLHDLKFVTGSGYHDLVAIMCEDWPEQAGKDKDGRVVVTPDAAYTLTGPNSATFTSAFMLKGNNPNTGTSTNMPIPAGWSHESTSPSRPNTQSTILGDLIFGRTPKWHLWADNINVGKYTVLDDGQLYFAYNIFKPRNGQQKPNLEQFENYGNGSNAHHPPFLNMGDDLQIEYHNSVACKAKSATLIPTFSNGFDSQGHIFGAISTKDNMRAFMHQLPPFGDDVKMGLGNLIDWHKTADQQIADDDDTHHLKYVFTGISASVYRNVPNTLGGKRLVGAAWEQSATDRTGFGVQPLSSNTTAIEIKKFRDGKNSDDTDYNWQINMCGEEKDHDLLYYETSEGSIQGTATLSAIVDTQRKTKEQGLSSGNLCNADYVMPIFHPTFSRENNPKMDNNATNYRTILMNSTVSISSATKYIYPLFTWNDSELQVRTRNKDSGTSGFVFLFCLTNDALSNQTNNSAVDLSSYNFKLSLELVTTQNDGSVARSFLEGDFSAGVVQQAYGYSQTPSQANYFYEANTLNSNSFISHMEGQSNSSNKLCKSIFIPIANIPSEHQAQYTDESNVLTLNRNTTARMWIELSTAVKPKVQIFSAAYDWVTAMWKLLFANSQYLLVDRTSLLTLTSNTNPINLYIETSDGNSIDIGNDSSSSSAGLVIEVYRDFNNTNVVDTSKRICRFILLKAVSGSPSPERGFQGYGGGGRSSEWDDGNYTLEVIAGGYTGFQLRITTSANNGWGNNNLCVRLRRSSTY